jgi:carbonic anhydrase
MTTHSSDNETSRRKFLQMGITGTAASLLAGGLDLAIPTRAIAQSTLTPDAALAELMAGHKRFIDNKGTAHTHDLEIIRDHTAEKQEPFAGILSCADSRVPVEIIFDQSIGHLFVTRIAGNLVTPEIIGSLEYGAAVLGTKVLIVMGHSNCGAVKATMQGKEVPGQISSLYPHIQPAVDQAGSDFEAVIKANARIQAALLRQASPVISGLIKEGKLQVIATYYDLASGAVTLLDKAA